MVGVGVEVGIADDSGAEVGVGDGAGGVELVDGFGCMEGAIVGGERLGRGFVICSEVGAGGLVSGDGKLAGGTEAGEANKSTRLTVSSD